MADAPDSAQACYLQAEDGVQLRLTRLATGGRGTILLFPGRAEVAEKYGRTARALTDHGFGVLTIDWRGQGLSDRLTPDPLLGHVANFADYQRDVASMLDAADALDLPRPHLLLAHSMGACIALRALIEGMEMRAVAFSAPLWGLPLQGPMRLAVRALASGRRILRRAPRAVPAAEERFRLAIMHFDDNELTSDRTAFEHMRQQVRAHPELQLGRPSLNWLAAALHETRRLAALPAPDIPAYAGVGSREKVVDPGAITARMESWPNGRIEVFAGGEHELMMEAPEIRDRYIAAVVQHFEANLPAS